MATLNLVIMAKPAIPGVVKTRLIGQLSARGAAQVHVAMLTCVMERARKLVLPYGQVNLILAMDKTLRHGTAAPYRIDPAIESLWQKVDQGTGDLGQRLAWVWQSFRDQPVVFLGGDSPDVPESVLGSIVPALDRAEVAIGAVDDGGYWTLASRHFQPRLLANVDWGTSSVYHQTLAAAQQAGLTVALLEPWYDVDQLSDVDALRQRIDGAQETVLANLRSALDCICREANR